MLGLDGLIGQVGLDWLDWLDLLTGPNLVLTSSHNTILPVSAR